MAQDPEALAQLARLLGDERLRDAAPDRVRAAVDGAFEALVAGLVAEAAASDDVIDTESALGFASIRVEQLSNLISADQKARLSTAVREKIEAW